MSERTQRLYDLLEKAESVVLTGHDRADADSVISCVLMQRLLMRWGMDARIALNDPDRQSRRVLAKFGVDVQALEGPVRAEDAVILLDHHQSAQPGRVLACVDHHPTDYPPKLAFVLIEDCGACAVTVLRLMQEAGVPVTQEDERLAVAALYLDTIALKSAKISPEEAAWGEREAARLGLDTDWLRREGMGLHDMSQTDEALAMLGKKAYDFGGRRVLSTYIQTDAMTKARLEGVLAALRRELAREGAALWVYLVHDPVRMRSTEYDVLPNGHVRVTEYGYLASRGRDVMPRVEREMRKEAP